MSPPKLLDRHPTSRNQSIASLLYSPSLFGNQTRITYQIHLNEWLYGVAPAFSIFTAKMIYRKYRNKLRSIETKFLAPCTKTYTITTNHHIFLKKIILQKSCYTKIILLQIDLQPKYKTITTKITNDYNKKKSCNKSLQH